MRYGIAAALLIMGLAITSCSFVQRVDRECSYTRDEKVCYCRNIDTGRFMECR